MQFFLLFIIPLRSTSNFLYYFHFHSLYVLLLALLLPPPPLFARTTKLNFSNIYYVGERTTVGNFLSRSLSLCDFSLELMLPPLLLLLVKRKILL
jgi:hypothetical protein